MSHEDGTAPTVLIVDDERATAESYASALSGEYEALTATSGQRALEVLESGDVDVLLLDRRMPEMSGNEVLSEIQRLKVDCRVAMVTAVEPDFDIVELGIDDYLVKPVGADRLRDTVERLLSLEALERARRELSSLKVKHNVLQLENGDEALAESEEFAELEARIERLEANLSELEEGLEGAGPGGRDR